MKRHIGKAMIFCYARGERPASKAAWNKPKPSGSFGDRLAEQARQAREQAKNLPPGPEHEELASKARRAETASQITNWLTADTGSKRPLNAGVFPSASCISDFKVTIAENRDSHRRIGTACRRQRF
jgi:hypothetical protein